MRSLPQTARQQGVARFAQAWAREILGASYPAIGLIDVEQRLRALSDRLVDALLAEPFTADPAAAVGAAVVEYTFGAADALAGTIEICGTRLLTDLRLGTADGYGARLAALQGGLAQGYAHALRERILAGQDSIHRAALHASDARFRMIFTGSAIGILINDGGGRIIDANDAFLRMLGVGPGQVQGRSIDEFAHPEDARELREAYAAQRTAGPEHIRMEWRFTGIGGSVVWAELTTSCLRDDDGRCRAQLSMIVDVTDRHLLQNQLRRQARHDPLTGLPNRTVLIERVHELMATGPERRIGLCFIDLDGFKMVNDSLGHDVGDRLLVAVTDRLRRVLSPEQLLVRMGGDEFVILVADTAGTADAVAVAETVLAALASPLRVGDHALSIGASIGIVERPVAGGDYADLLRAADITLYRAKAEGKGRWALFEAERGARQVTRHTLSTMLPRALEQDQFVVEYQPIIALGDGAGARMAAGAMVGVEALVRWRHPGLGLLPPDLFIGMAEETGQIVPLGRRVLELACRQARQWQECHPHALFVSVNLAARQTREAGLVEQVRRILDETGLSPDLLQLELTESAFMGTADEPLRVLRGLAEMGVRIAIDDFGTGYSNLAYLRRLPVHTLKLAGPFVEGFHSARDADPGDEEIVQTLVTLAHTLRLTVTAEGVETPMQAERLRAAACDSAQGFLFAPPLTAEEITQRILTRSAGSDRTSSSPTQAARAAWAR
ncbi:EAL domain-containing protein [Frankia sp. B2]|uniref:putative bifunctional diguanylate cyclase/phosphodiesterase n=1 Tax=unclassified Frankia TaxID=2632575 RepID=UPI0003D04335|nr:MULTISPECIES: EAL domain-containing protein [unclassified Frankia]ETA01398.1 diguanylate cyclase/phosphodiesterase with PAS/PAC sensor(s) [Frankia sp. CcI6]KDA41412.1 diguanylate cyclase/phosphodiesterase with PAS/PAC sensor(s) [Frankia sp. BMG5.23]KFB05545.1 diguanylate cyclase/phosphodiesterase with PAS/PAC sensor(s) [Frankia sp. Allo2]TFE30180.1 EAL domain-containing protein [Frankia sp. B2]